MPEHELINPLTVENWNNLLATLPGYSFFHTANWADVLSQSYGYEPLYLCNKTNNTMSGLLPLMEVKSILTGTRGVSLPFSDACPLLVSNTQAFQDLFQLAVTWGKKRKWKYIELRGGGKYLAAENPAATFLGHVLDLSRGSEQLFSGLRNSTRRNIKKAMNEKVDVSISRSSSAMKEFCRLNVITRKEHGLPPQPDRFFHRLHDLIIARGMGFISVASVFDRTIAANVYLHFGREVIYKYGASDKRYQHLRANNLVMWEAVKWCCDKGFKEMNLGRTEPVNRGLMQFKDGWGAKPYQIAYYKYNLQQNSFVSKGETLRPSYQSILSIMPGPVLKILGRYLYRHMG